MGTLHPPVHTVGARKGPHQTSTSSYRSRCCPGRADGTASLVAEHTPPLSGAPPQADNFSSSSDKSSNLEPTTVRHPFTRTPEPRGSHLANRTVPCSRGLRLTALQLCRISSDSGRSMLSLSLPGESRDAVMGPSRRGRRQCTCSAISSATRESPSPGPVP